MDQELLMKQIVEQVMNAMSKGVPAPAAPGGRMTAANYPLAEKESGKIKTPTGKPFSSLSYEKVLSGELTADDMRISPRPWNIRPRWRNRSTARLSRATCAGPPS